jgi:hypothetical protein
MLERRLPDNFSQSAVEHARAMVAWKRGGEQGPVPKEDFGPPVTAADRKSRQV